MIVNSDQVTWLGTVVSIVGAAVAIWQAWEAWRAARKAATIRDEIASTRAHLELNDFDKLLIAALQAMDKYGPGRKPSQLRGLSNVKDADAVRSLTAAMSRHEKLLSKSFGSKSGEVCDRLNAMLIEFGNATTTDDLIDHGRAIYTEISTLSGNLKGVLDDRAVGR